MKRFAQFVAVMGIALLAVQPILASQPCVFGSVTACVPGCPMAMDAMGSDCSMPGQMAESGCPQSCCDHRALQAIVQPATQDKSRPSALSHLLVLSAAPAAADQALAPRVDNEPRGVSPPRYILNQVFRI